VFNAFKYTKQLEEAGFSRVQAEIQLQVIAEFVEGDLATKQDLKDLKIELKNDIALLESKMVQMEYRLTLKLGTIVTIGLGAMTAIVKLL